VHSVNITVPSFVKTPRAAVVRAGDSPPGSPNPFFVSDPGIYSDAEGMHLVTTALFCSQDNGWYFSYDPQDYLRCNPANATSGWLYGFSADDGATWEYRPEPYI
jgi:hypothetical protein